MIAVALAASRADGFGLSDIELVPWAWQIIDGAVNHFGWVVLLRDRRRVYLRYRVDEAKGVEVEDLKVERLERGVRRPDTDGPGVHWLVPKHVNWALGLPARGAQEQPEDLRELAKRTRFLATAVGEPDRSRMLAYADDLEDVAATLEQYPESDPLAATTYPDWPNRGGMARRELADLLRTARAFLNES